MPPNFTEDGVLQISWYHRIFFWLIRFLFKVPPHIAFIMDGNRRFARSNNMELQLGHSAGFDTMLEVLGWCRHLGVTQTTVYALSVDNWSRSEKEVNYLVELARDKACLMREKRSLIGGTGVCVRFVGEKQRVPYDLKQAMRDLEQESARDSNNSKSCRLNICFSYSGREEIISASEEIKWGVDQGILHIDDVSENLMGQCILARGIGTPPDLVIRTSGEVRLSDFLLWQTDFTPLVFLAPLWPQMSVWQLFKAIFRFQFSYRQVKSAQRRTESLKSTSTDFEQLERIEKFLQLVEQRSYN